MSVLHICGQPQVNNNNILQKSMPDLAGSYSSVGSVSIFSINIQCLLAHIDELICQLNVHRPHIVFLQETWLDPTTENISIPGDKQVSRRDCHAGVIRRGILALQRNDF